MHICNIFILLSMKTHLFIYLFCFIFRRLFEERELYVCYQENMSQSSVEIIFKLLFGSNIF